MFRLALLNPTTDERHPLARQRVAGRCGATVPLRIPLAEQGGVHGETGEAMGQAGVHPVLERGADAPVLACGGMTDVARSVQDRVGVAFGSLRVYEPRCCGLETSTSGADAFPELIDDAAMDVPGAGR